MPRIRTRDRSSYRAFSRSAGKNPDILDCTARNTVAGSEEWRATIDLTASIGLVAVSA
jgi:hypothetical protein